MISFSNRRELNLFMVFHIHGWLVGWIFASGCSCCSFFFPLRYRKDLLAFGYTNVFCKDQHALGFRAFLYQAAEGPRVLWQNAALQHFLSCNHFLSCQFF